VDIHIPKIHFAYKEGIRSRHPFQYSNFFITHLQNTHFNALKQVSYTRALPPLCLKLALQRRVWSAWTSGSERIGCRVPSGPRQISTQAPLPTFTGPSLRNATWAIGQKCRGGRGKGFSCCCRKKTRKQNRVSRTEHLLFFFSGFFSYFHFVLSCAV
jgi:hypothetical protein